MIAISSHLTEMKCIGASFVRDITVKDSRHISVKTIEYKNCTNFISSSPPISVMQKAKRKKLMPETIAFLTAQCGYIKPMLTNWSRVTRASGKALDVVAVWFITP